MRLAVAQGSTCLFDQELQMDVNDTCVQLQLKLAGAVPEAPHNRASVLSVFLIPAESPATFEDGSIGSSVAEGGSRLGIVEATSTSGISSSSSLVVADTTIGNGSGSISGSGSSSGNDNVRGADCTSSSGNGNGTSSLLIAETITTYGRGSLSSGNGDGNSSDRGSDGTSCRSWSPLAHVTVLVLPPDAAQELVAWLEEQHLTHEQVGPLLHDLALLIEAGTDDEEQQRREQHDEVAYPPDVVAAAVANGGGLCGAAAAAGGVEKVDLDLEQQGRQGMSEVIGSSCMGDLTNRHAAIAVAPGVLAFLRDSGLPACARLVTAQLQQLLGLAAVVGGIRVNVSASAAVAGQTAAQGASSAVAAALDATAALPSVTAATASADCVDATGAFVDDSSTTSSNEKGSPGDALLGGRTPTVAALAGSSPGGGCAAGVFRPISAAKMLSRGVTGIRRCSKGFMVQVQKCYMEFKARHVACVHRFYCIMQVVASLIACKMLLTMQQPSEAQS
jgi:hypothetical protein